MPALTRKFKKIFGSSSTKNGVFGSAAALAPAVSTNPETIESLAAFLNGWEDATEGGLRLPTLQDLQGLKYDTDYHLAYIYQDGLQNYNSQTTYYINNYVREEGTAKIWKSLINNNTGNSLVEGANWTLVANLVYTPASAALLASNNLSDLVSASTARTNLGLAIGVNVQAYNANLQALSGLTGAANKIPSFTGVGAMALLTTGTSSGNVPLVGTQSATDTLAGLIELITNAELATGTDSTRAVTAAALASLFGTSYLNTSNANFDLISKLANSSFVKPIIKSGSVSVSGNGTADITFTNAFPTAIIGAYVSNSETGTGPKDGCSAYSWSTTGFTIVNGASGTLTLPWIAIGY